MRSWQKSALIMASCAAVGLIVWSHTMSESAFRRRLPHLPDRLHVESNAYQDRAISPTENVAVTDRVSPDSVMLFDDTAKLAIDAQRRRDQVAQAEKKQAALEHVNLEWQRHHHLDGSVFQSIKGHS